LTERGAANLFKIREEEIDNELTENSLLCVVRDREMRIRREMRGRGSGRPLMREEIMAESSRGMTGGRE
jgi:hypothetical protein